MRCNFSCGGGKWYHDIREEFDVDSNDQMGYVITSCVREGEGGYNCLFVSVQLLTVFHRGEHIISFSPCSFSHHNFPSIPPSNTVRNQSLLHRSSSTQRTSQIKGLGSRNFLVQQIRLVEWRTGCQTVDEYFGGCRKIDWFHWSNGILDHVIVLVGLFRTG